ncbi:Hypothetical protein, putative [Bodo saltans]|uniref:Uncharacterized protein n=1 Tax=Bodo saltans TaxID=75058 RepID=A0A0S4JGS9_BODSA|nr:Hypothetical protein, putative [Bodo saltans]|eukprot:CUG89355.1 Hypothetical protein, putative [Bodo saltans]
MKILDEGLRSSRDAAGRKHEDAVRSLEGEFKAELQRKKLQLSQQTDDELLRHRRAEEDRMATRLKALKDDVASHVELSIRNLRDAGVDGGNQFLEAVRLEQRAFLSAVANGMDATKRVATEQHAEDVELLKATLQAEKTAIHNRIREIQGECAANISVMKVENAATLAAMAKEFESQKAALEADHKDDIQKLIRDLRATAETELREIKEEYHRKQQQQQHHLLHPLAIDAATVNSSFEDSTTSAAAKPLSRFAHPHQETLVSDLSAQQGLMEAIAAAEHSSSGESASGSLVDLAHSLHAATQTSTPAASSKAAPPPMLSEKDLGLSNSTSRTLPPGEDLRSVITEVLRDLFKNSPFILPSPASQNPSVQVSPSNHFGREIEHNVPPLYKGPASPTSTLHSQQQQQQQQPHSSVGRSVPSHHNNGNSPQQQQHNVSHNPPTAQALHQLNTSMAPESYQEQRQLLVDERRRLQEAKAFVENQRTSLEERRTQLKSARRHWKADVMDAKAQGVVATSKKGLLLQKVHKVLDKQAVGLQHDDNLLKDSEHWLKTKEQRLVKLELQFDEHERSRQGTHDMSMASVDTTVLLTGYFKPPLLTQHQPQPEETHPGSVLIAAKAGGATAAASSTAAAVHKSHKASHHTHHVVPSSSTAAPSGTTAAVASVAGGGVITTTRSISPMLSKALERIEKRLDKVAHLVATTSAVPKQSQYQQQRSSSDATAGRRSGRTSRSNSRGRHVDFAPTTFSDPWVEISPAMA